MRHKLIAMMLTVCLLVGVLPAALVSAADPDLTYNSAGGYYEISSVDDWSKLAAYVANGNSCAGMTFKLTDDIGTVEKQIGAHVKKTDYAFEGVFDGNGKTLTVNLKSSDSAFSDGQYCSPFAYTKNAVIENLHVDGTIESSDQHMAGLVGHADGTITVTNCRISVALTSTHHVNGNGNVNLNKAEKAGGVIGYAAGNATISNTVFDGKLLGEDYTYSGGFIGENRGSATIADCSFVPSEVAAGVHTTGADTFVPTNNGSCTYEGVNVYDAELGSTAASNNPSVKRGYHVTVAGDIENGAVTASTQVSTEGETVTLTVVPAEGYELESITCTDGNDTAVEVSGSDGEYTFTMPASDVIISAVFTEATVITEPEFVDEVAMVLSGKIGLTFSMILPENDEIEYDASYMTFEDTENASKLYVMTTNGEDDRLYLPVENGSYNGADREYTFTVFFSSIQMAAPIQATFHYPVGDLENGGEWKTVEMSYTYSAEQYFSSFDQVTDQFTVETKNLVHAVADYGYYVQPFLEKIHSWAFGYDYKKMNTYYTESFNFEAVKQALSNGGVTGSQKNNETNGDVDKITYSLLLESGTAIRVYFKPADGYEGRFDVSCSNTAHKVGKSGARWYVEIPNISAQNLDTVYTIQVTTENGTAVVNVSALSYVYDALNAYTDSNDSGMINRNAVASLYYYWKAAEDYVGSQH